MKRKKMKKMKKRTKMRRSDKVYPPDPYYARPD